MLTQEEAFQENRDEEWTFQTTVGSLIDLAGEQEVKTFIEEKASEASYKEDYENTKSNIIQYWLHLCVFILGFAVLAIITLEFIDKDKR